jgi:hypothetical protein
VSRLVEEIAEPRNRRLTEDEIDAVRIRVEHGATPFFGNWPMEEALCSILSEIQELRHQVEALQAECEAGDAALLRAERESAALRAQLGLPTEEGEYHSGPAANTRDFPDEASSHDASQ